MYFPKLSICQELISISKDFYRPDFNTQFIPDPEKPVDIEQVQFSISEAVGRVLSMAKLRMEVLNTTHVNFVTNGQFGPKVSEDFLEYFNLHRQKAAKFLSLLAEDIIGWIKTSPSDAAKLSIKLTPENTIQVIGQAFKPLTSKKQNRSAYGRTARSSIYPAQEQKAA